MPFLPEFMLSIVAGGSIGLGGMFFVIVLADAGLGFAIQRVLGGTVFSLGDVASGSNAGTYFGKAACPATPTPANVSALGSSW